MLASIFVIQGFDTLIRPERVSPRAEPVVRPLAERVPPVPGDTEQAVRLNAAVQVVAGSLLAAGRLPRLSALALAATLVPTTLAGHRFWEVQDKQEREQQRIAFMKNISMLGGLLIATADTAGSPSLAWRSRHAARAAARAARRDMALAARAAKVSGKAAKVSGKAGKVSGKAGAKAGQLSAKAGQAAKVSGKAGAKAAKLGSHLPVG
jgi:uncharacterized membrane protein YphA (DoxX/SURF4 family)